MDNRIESYPKTKNSENANNPSHYVLLAIGIFVAVLGMLLRFLGEWSLIDIVSNIVLIIGAILCIKAVISILK